MAVIDGWIDLAEFVVALQPYDVPGWSNPLAEFVVTLQPMETPGWGNPLAEFVVTLTPPGVETCEVDADCPEGYVCKGGVCVPKEAEFPLGWLLLGGSAAAAAIILLTEKKKPEAKKEGEKR